jgi:hypothetical protein
MSIRWRGEGRKYGYIAFFTWKNVVLVIDLHGFGQWLLLESLSIWMLLTRSHPLQFTQTIRSMSQINSQAFFFCSGIEKY